MKISDNLPGKARSFEEMVRVLGFRESQLRCRLLKTIRFSNFFTDDVILSKLTPNENQKLDQLCTEAAVSEEHYQSAEKYPISELIPKEIGPEVKSVEFAGGNDKIQFLLLKGWKREAFVEADYFHTIQKRHSDARWFFSNETDFWKKPIVLLDIFNEESTDAELLGIIATIAIEPTKTIEWKSASNKWIRHKTERSWRYRKCE